ncbi:hypothetical protein C6985_25575 [Escherichia coli]|nr:hypothetical protein C6985_25575 [Escherichia coli]
MLSNSISEVTIFIYWLWLQQLIKMMYLRENSYHLYLSVTHIWCPLSSQEFQDLPDGAETTLTRKRQCTE